MVVDVVVVTSYKVMTGADRRRAVDRARDASAQKDYATVVEELEPHERDLSYVDTFRYLRAKDLLRRAHDNAAKRPDADL